MVGIPNTGMLISSGLFAYGYYSSPPVPDDPRADPEFRGFRGIVHVDKVTDGVKMMPIAMDGGPEADMGAYDPTRAVAIFVVENIEKRGEDGWLVWASRLKPDGTYDRLAEQVRFYVAGEHADTIPLGDITLHLRRRMVRKFEHL